MALLNPRIRTDLHNISVVLNYGPLGFIKATTECIGHDHIQVNTGSIALNHDAEVEIVMSIASLEHREQHRIAAQVGYCDESGHTTLNFLCCSGETIQALQPYVTIH